MDAVFDSYRACPLGGGDKVNRKQKLMATYRKLAEKAVDAHMEYKLTFLFAASVLALQKAHAKVNWDNYFRYFQEIYQDVLDDPDSKVKEAEEILGGKLEFQMPREWESEL